MTEFWKEVRLAAIMGLVVPGLILSIAVSIYKPRLRSEYSEEPKEERKEVMIPVLHEGRTTEMELNNYLTGVVLAEMPASFEPEAQKAQAVVARTYTIRAWERGGKHEGAAVCTDSNCCQGYISEEAYLAKGGTEENVEKMRSAVTETENLVLTFDGQLIEATYFSCSGGSTEDAVAVWGTDVPYLQAVESPGEEHATHYTDTVSFTAEDFAAALGRNFSGDPASWFGAVTYTAGGGVAAMQICGEAYSGTSLRKALGLRSTAFSVAIENNAITITTRGYGHRVGMSQYGADAMAAQGSSFEEILAHYYRGTSLTEWVH